ncbi:MAG: hypothetical protein K6G75_12695 [Lachnospiraceae bacterium]|nr:hypothetical protein [Lachnospiraceae bacterium]
MPSYGRDLIIFLVMLLINAIVSVVYYLLARFVFESKESKYSKEEKDKKHSLEIRLIVMLIVPVIGPIFFIVSWLIYKVFFSEPVDLEDVIFSKDKVKFNVRAEEEKERNLTSLEEAVEITDKKELRTLMMSVVGGDIRKFLSSINFALTSNDSETAHYAASVMQDALNDFRINVAKRIKKMNEDEDNKAVHAEALIEYMNAILEQKVFIDMEQREYVDKLDEAADILYEEGRDRITEEHMEKVALRLLETGEYDKCEKWCDRLKIVHPLTLATYTCRLKLLFNMGRKEEFFETIEELKNSSIVIDKETLELIRVFRQN